MAHDPNSEDEQLSLPAAEPRARSGTRHMLLAGVAGACVLGVGAGLWARPAESERRTTAPAVAKVAEAPRPTGRLEIVVDDSPAPIGAPIEVLPAMTGQAADADAIEPAPAPEAEPLAPVRAPAGLVRVQSIEPVQMEAAPAPVAKAAPKPEAKTPDPKKLETRQAEAAKAKAKLAELRVAEAKAKKAEKAKRDEKALAERARKDVRLAKDEARAKADAARQAKAKDVAKAKELAKAQELAKAKDRAKLAKAKTAKAVQTADARKPTGLAKLLAKVTHHAKPSEPPRKVAKAEPKPKKLKTEKAVLKRAPAPAPAKPAKIKRDSSFRLASNRCVSADPGEALVCADAGLGAADRQLNRAYRQAEAAGVSTATLARQQARWLSARAQAAREAPWAVRDVYEARIAELNDQTRDARREY